MTEYDFGVALNGLDAAEVSPGDALTFAQKVEEVAEEMDFEFEHVEAIAHERE